MRHFGLLIFLLIPASLWAQFGEKPKLEIGGYVKDLVTINVAGNDSTLVDNLIHHRLNVDWYPTDNLSANIEFRNRIFFGGLVNTIPNYGELIDVNNDYFDLSWMPANNDDLIIHLMIDRAYLRWTKNDWEITAGRQRINWGVNLVWNPNDLFNSYSFFDFDYEERPGSDALRIRKYTGFASEIEFSIKAADSFEELTSAIKYQVNRWGYDIQFIGGVVKNNLTLGAGWAGNIKTAGLKGEMTYLNDFDTKEPGFLASVSADYSFSNSLYLNGSFLYSSYGKPSPDLFLFNTSSNLDIRTLSPYRWSTFLQGSYPVHPLVNVGLANMFFPSDGSLFVNPSVTVSVVPNVDFDFVGQLFFGEDQNSVYRFQTKIFYFRLKWSY